MPVVEVPFDFTPGLVSALTWDPRVTEESREDHLSIDWLAEVLTR